VTLDEFWSWYDTGTYTSIACGKSIRATIGPGEYALLTSCLDAEVCEGTLDVVFTPTRA
jgi:hypothetical protein